MRRIVLMTMMTGAMLLSGCTLFTGSFEGVEQAKERLELGEKVDLQKCVSWDEKIIKNVELKDDGGLSTNKLGEYTVTYEITNIKDNKQDIQFVFEVKDTKAPTLNMISSDIYIKKGDVFEIDDYAKSIDISGTQKIEYTGLVDTEKEGTYEITVSSVDDSGNSSVTKNATVTVEDRSDCVIRNVKFGDSLESVKRYENAEFAFEEDNDDGTHKIMYYDKIAGVESCILYRFDLNDELYWVDIGVDETHSDVDYYADDFDAYLAALIEKYGDPTDSEENKSTYFRYCSSVCQAISLGAYSLDKIWEFEDYKIILSAYGSSGDVFISFSVWDKSRFADLCNETAKNNRINSGL